MEEALQVEREKALPEDYERLVRFLCGGRGRFGLGPLRAGGCHM
jgi:hypothetical protein